MRLLIADFAGHGFEFQLSRELAEAGHHVLHTYCVPNHTPKGILACSAGLSPLLRISPVMAGWSFQTHSILGRFVRDHGYGLAVAAQIRQFRPTVVISANAPLDAQKILLPAARLVKATFVYWLQDVLSAAMTFALRQQSSSTAGIVEIFYSWLEKKLLCGSDAVVSITPGFLDTLFHWGVPREKVRVIENWAPLDEVRPVPRDNSWAREQGLAGKFCFMYSGTLGLKHPAELLLRLARHFESRENVAVVVIADGAGADWLRGHALMWPRSLRLLPFQPYERLSEVLGTADVLVSLLKGECGALSVPSKTLTYLCAGRAILAAAPAANLGAQVIGRAGAGEVVEDSSPEEFLAAADRLYAEDARRLVYGSQARAYAERAFDIRRIQQEFLDVFDFVLQKRPSKGGLQRACVSARP
jgi:colanic acid biosynthesis glycosyl transferase WcaI